MIVIALFGLLSGILGAFFGAKASAGFARNLRKDMYDNITKFSFSNIDRFSTSGLHNNQSSGFLETRLSDKFGLRFLPDDNG